MIYLRRSQVHFVFDMKLSLHLAQVGYFIVLTSFVFSLYVHLYLFFLVLHVHVDVIIEQI